MVDAGDDVGRVTGWDLTVETSGGPPPPPPTSSPATSSLESGVVSAGAEPTLGDTGWLTRGCRLEGFEPLLRQHLGPFLDDLLA